MKFSCLCCIVSCFSSAGVQAQHLQGAYYTVAKERGFSSELFLFSGDHFFYQHAGCLGVRTGEGSFKVEAGRLLLIFSKSMADTSHRVSFFARPLASPPSFLVRVTDTNGEPLPGAVITSTLTLNAGASTDATGSAILNYNPPPHDKLLIRYVGYDPISILLPAAGQGVAVRLGPPYYFTAGDTLTFQLKSSAPTMLVLRQFLDLADSNNSRIRYEHCGRIPAEEAKKQLARTQ